MRGSVTEFWLQLNRSDETMKERREVLGLCSFRASSHDFVDAKRFLYSRGDIRRFRMKAERIRSSSQKPQSSAILAIRSCVSSS
jgi:hypothetical protein